MNMESEMKASCPQSARLVVRNSYQFLRAFGLLLICAAWLLPACTPRPTALPTPAEREARQVSLAIRLALAEDGKSIDYDTAMDVHRQIVSSPAPIPQVEELLREMIEQRNADPRIDQIVLILAAHAIGASQFPVPDAQRLFERILEQDAERINHWVLAFVADAIGNYPVDLPGGDALVDRVEAWQSRLDGESALEKEYFGRHFLPPPKSRTIRTHLAGITDQAARQRERNAYYMLVHRNIPEGTIVAAVDYLGRHGLPGSGEIPPYPLASLVENWHLLPEEMKQP
jgi:hypothetical protein